MKFYLPTLKHLVIQLTKLQIYTLNLITTFWHCKKNPITFEQECTSRTTFPTKSHGEENYTACEIAWCIYWTRLSNRIDTNVTVNKCHSYKQHTKQFNENKNMPFIGQRCIDGAYGLNICSTTCSHAELRSTYMVHKRMWANNQFCKVRP